MKKIISLVLCGIITLMLFSCKGKAVLTDKPIITFEFEEMVFNPNDPAAEPAFSDFAKVSFQLYTKDAKKEVELFIKSIKSGYYNAKVEGEANSRFRYSLNEPDHMYFMKLNYKKVKVASEGGGTVNEIKDVVKDKPNWEESINPASNIKIMKGVICLNGQNKGELIIFKSELTESGKFIPIGQATPDSAEQFDKLVKIETSMGSTERTQQGQVVTSNPVNRFIFIKNVTITE